MGNENYFTDLHAVAQRADLALSSGEREFFIDNLLVRSHRCFWWTGLAPWEFDPEEWVTKVISQKAPTSTGAPPS